MTIDPTKTYTATIVDVVRRRHDRARREERAQGREQLRLPRAPGLLRRTHVAPRRRRTSSSRAATRRATGAAVPGYTTSVELPKDGSTRSARVACGEDAATIPTGAAGSQFFIVTGDAAARIGESTTAYIGDRSRDQGIDVAKKIESFAAGVEATARRRRPLYIDKVTITESVGTPPRSTVRAVLDGLRLRALAVDGRAAGAHDLPRTVAGAHERGLLVDTDEHRVAARAGRPTARAGARPRGRGTGRSRGRARARARRCTRRRADRPSDRRARSRPRPTPRSPRPARTRRPSPRRTRCPSAPSADAAASRRRCRRSARPAPRRRSRRPRRRAGSRPASPVTRAPRPSK